MTAQDNFYETRLEMVEEQIKARGIKDEKVIQAMQSVPRHLFVPKNKINRSYWDQALSIGYGQTISQPYVVAFTLDVLDLKEDDVVLEVGTGSGYLAALLAEIVTSVVTIEIVEELGLNAEELLGQMGYENIDVIIGDGFFGFELKAPYDKIIVSAGAKEVPQPLIEQLKVGGQLIMPIGPKGELQKLTLFTKKKDKISRKVVESVRFVPLTRGDD